MPPRTFLADPEPAERQRREGREQRFLPVSLDHGGRAAMASSPERVLAPQPAHLGSRSGSAAWQLEGTPGNCSSGPRFVPLGKEAVS